MKNVMFVRGLLAIMLLLALGALPACGENAWDQLKSGIDAAMEDLGNAYKKAVAEFSK
jgi:hypothetical protein